MPPTPVLSLRSDRSPSLSSQPPPAPAGEQTSLSGWWVLVGTDPPCGNLSALPSTPLWLRSPPWLWSFPPLPPAVSTCEGAPSVWKPFLLHSSLPLVRVPSLFFVSVFCFFFCPTQVQVGSFLPFGRSEIGGLLPAFSGCSIGVVPHVDVFLVYLWGGRWSPRLTLPPSWSSSLHHIFFIYSSVSGHLGCFCVLALVNSAAVSTGVHVSLQIRVFIFFWIFAQEWDCWIIMVTLFLVV